MEIDIRNNSEEIVDIIRFSEHDIIKHDDNVIEIIDEDDPPSCTTIYKKDIDNLILALQKAKELWGDEG